MARSSRLSVPVGEDLRVQEEGRQRTHQRRHEPLVATNLSNPIWVRYI